MRKHLRCREYKCDLCPKSYTSAYNLKTHRMIHTNTYEFACKLCNKLFRSSGKVRQHVTKAHKIEIKTRFNAHDITPDQQFWEKITIKKDEPAE